jgi:hypothetical protein
MSPANQANPDTTNATGSFGWDVLAGFYKVRAEKDGCTAPGTGGPFVETGVLTIPPPVADLGLVLDCPPIGTTITELGDAHGWIGLKNGDDQGTKFDLRVQLLQGDTVVATGIARCISGVTRNPLLAKDASVSWNPFTPVTVGSLDELSLQLSARIGTAAGTATCSGHGSATGVRLYYDAASRNSRFALKILGASSSVTEYLHSDGAACNNAESVGVFNRFINPTAPGNVPAKCKDSGTVKLAGGNQWITIGTWGLQALP